MSWKMRIDLLRRLSSCSESSFLLRALEDQRISGSYADCRERSEKLQWRHLPSCRIAFDRRNPFGKGREEGHGCRANMANDGSIRNAGVLEDTATKIDSTTSTDGGLVHELRGQALV